MPPDGWGSILEHLRSIGITKINLAGGEPMLYPYLYELCDIVKSLGFTLSIVTNGSLITMENFGKLAQYIDWLGLSIDSPDEEDEILVGRHCSGVNHLEHVTELAELAHELGIKVKLNITVLRQSWNKDFRKIIRMIRPDRIKVLRALTLKNANDDRPDTWSITDGQFEAFRKRHEGIPNIVFEDNSDMIGTYLMFDPIGRWTVNTGGEKRFLSFEQFVRDGPGSLLNIDGYYRRNGAYKW